MVENEVDNLKKIKQNTELKQIAWEIINQTFTPEGYQPTDDEEIHFETQWEFLDIQTEEREKRVFGMLTVFQLWTPIIINLIKDIGMAILAGQIANVTFQWVSDKIKDLWYEKVKKEKREPKLTEKDEKMINAITENVMSRISNLANHSQ